MGGGVWAAGDGDDWGVLDHHDASELCCGCFACVEDLGVVMVLALVGGFVGEVFERDEGEGLHR